MHYEHNLQAPEVEDGGKLFWSSEDYQLTGAQTWARDIIRNYVNNNMTATIAWSTIWAVLDGLPDAMSGLMLANSPWSGHYEVAAPIWVSAHVCQFTQPGWRFLLTGQGSGLLGPAGADVGSYMTLVPPEGPASGFTLVVETMGKPGAVVEVALLGGLPGPGTVVHVWQTTQAAYFVALPDLVVSPSGTLNVTLPPDGVVTITTVGGGGRGSPRTPVPAPAPFPLPYFDDFSEYPYDGIARYLSDQAGSFAVRNGSLHQVVTTSPVPNSWVYDADPITVLGDAQAWVNVTLGVTAAFAAPPMSSGTLYPPATLAPCTAALNQVWALDSPANGYISNTIPGDNESPLCLNVLACNSQLIYYACVTSGGTCCGPDCYAGLQFTLDPTTGALSSSLPSLAGQCVTAGGGGGGSVAMAPCAPGAPAQQWVHNASTGVLQSVGSGWCLQSPLAPPQTYVQVCARITGYDGQRHPKPVPGVCVVLNSTGGWQVVAGSTVLTSGVLPDGGPGFDPRLPRDLQLSVQGAAVHAVVAGQEVDGVVVPPGFLVGGLVGFGSGFHAAEFDAFALKGG